MKFFSFMAMAISFTLQFSTSAAEIKVLYGDDDRVETIYASSAYQGYASAVAAQIKTSFLTYSQNGDVTIENSTLSERLNVCSDETFANQVSTALCSGFLIASNKLVTAGHCVPRDDFCTDYKWVFNYNLDPADPRKVVVDMDKDVYGCKSIIKREETATADYAIIELDRSILHIKALRPRGSGEISVGDPLVVIGYPNGIPQKIADGANVRSVLETQFVANLDTFQSNSGSPVINTNTGEVEGILVMGETDYITDPERGCKIINRLANDEGEGETASKISQLPAQYLKEPSLIKEEVMTRDDFLNRINRRLIRDILAFLF